MRTTSLDILEKAELPPMQSHAILKVMELELASVHESLATKADMRELRMATKADMTELRMATKSDLTELRTAAKADLTELRTAAKADLTELRTATKNDLNNAVHSLEMKMEGLESRLTRWIFTCILGQSAVIAGAVYFALAHLR